MAETEGELGFSILGVPCTFYCTTLTVVVKAVYREMETIGDIHTSSGERLEEEAAITSWD